MCGGSFDPRIDPKISGRSDVEDFSLVIICFAYYKFFPLSSAI